MADYVSFQPNLPSFGSDYLAQGFAGALALPNYFQNVDRQGELWKYAQEMQPLDKRSKELSNEQMSLANQGLQYGLSEKQVADVVNRALLSDPSFTQMTVDNTLAGLAAGQADSANKASTNQADAAYQIATLIKDWPETVRRQYMDHVGGPFFRGELKESLIKDPSKYMDSYKANAPYARQYGLESLQGMWGAKTAAAGRDRPMTPMEQAQARLSSAYQRGDMAAVEEIQKEIAGMRGDVNRPGKTAAETTTKQVGQEVAAQTALSLKGKAFTDPATGQKTRFRSLPIDEQNRLVKEYINSAGKTGQPQVSKPGIQTSKGGLEFTVKPRGNQ